MKCLVIGGFGFIGQAVVRALQVSQCTALVADHRPVPADLHVRAEHVFSKDVQGLTRAFAVADYAIYLDFDADVLRTALLLSGNQDVPMVLASSCAVYGRPQSRAPIAEESDLRPASAYGLAKLAAEQQARCVHSGAPVSKLRIFNVYCETQSPHLRTTSIITRFCHALARGHEICLRGNGQQVRDFIHVEDVAAACLAALPSTRQRSFTANICTGVGSSLVDVLRRLEVMCGKRADLKFTPAQLDDVAFSVGNAELFARLAGFRAKIPLEEGLQRCARRVRQLAS